MTAHKNEIGAVLKGYFIAKSEALAAGTGDATEVTGATIDLSSEHPQSAKILIPYSTTLAEDKTLSLAVEYQESDDNSTWDTAVSLYSSTVVATGDTGGSTETGVWEYDIDLSDMKRYFRVNFTPDLSATNTDTSDAIGVLVIGGAKENPITASA